MKSNILKTLLFLIFPVIGMTQGNLKTLENEVYSFQYPVKWYSEDLEGMGVILIDDIEKPKLITTFMIMPSDGTTLDETRTGLLEESGLDNARVVKDEMVKLGDQNVLHLVFLGTNADSSEPFRIEEFFAVHNNQSFMLVFACSEDVYTEVEKSIIQISNSLKLK